MHGAACYRGSRRCESELLEDEPVCVHAMALRHRDKFVLCNNRPVTTSRHTRQACVRSWHQQEPASATNSLEQYQLCGPSVPKLVSIRCRQAQHRLYSICAVVGHCTRPEFGFGAIKGVVCGDTVGEKLILQGDKQTTKVNDEPSSKQRHGTAPGQLPCPPTMVSKPRGTDLNNAFS